MQKTISINMPSSMQEAGSYFEQMEQEFKKIFADYKEKYISQLSCTFQDGKASISFYTQKDATYNNLEERNFTCLQKTSQYDQIYSLLTVFPAEVKTSFKLYKCTFLGTQDYQPVHVDVLCAYLKTCSILSEADANKTSEAATNKKLAEDANKKITEIYNKIFSLENLESNNHHAKTSSSNTDPELVLQDLQILNAVRTSLGALALQLPLNEQNQNLSRKFIVQKLERLMYIELYSDKDSKDPLLNGAKSASHSVKQLSEEGISACGSSRSKWWHSFSNTEKFVIVVGTILTFILGCVLFLIPPIIIILMLFQHYESFQQNILQAQDQEEKIIVS